MFVDMAGIMEIRTHCDDSDARFDPVDLLELQKGCPDGIPDSYFHKDYSSGEQNYVHCLVCSCDLNSAVSLSAHAGGKKHINKALAHKRRELGLSDGQPVAMAATKDLKKKPPRPRGSQLHLTLEQRLKEEEDQPCLGLEHVTEFLCRSRPDQHRLYTCSLEGCSSAWGTSDDMVNHVRNPKHQKNYLHRAYPDDPRVISMNAAEVLRKAFDHEETSHGGVADRDYSLIEQVVDDDRYYEIHDRPKNWSAKKAKFTAAMNANSVPVGNRKRSYLSSFSSSVTSVADLFPKTSLPGMSSRDRRKEVKRKLQLQLELDRDEVDTSSSPSLPPKEAQRFARRLRMLRALALTLKRRQGRRSGDDDGSFWPGFDQSLDDLEQRVRQLLQPLEADALGLRLSMIRLELDGEVDPGQFGDQVRRLEQDFARLSFEDKDAGQGCVREERKKIRLSLDLLKKQLERMQLDSTVDADAVPSLRRPAAPAVSKREAVRRLRRELRMFLARVMEPYFLPQRERKARLRGGLPKCEELVERFAEKIAEAEAEAWLRSWEELRLNRSIEEQAAKYVKEKLQRRMENMY